MKFSKIFLLFVACLGITSIMANDVDYVMKITLSDGTVDTYMVDECPQVSLDDKFVKVWTNDLSARYVADSVVNYTFANFTAKKIEGMNEEGDDYDATGATGITFKYVDGETVVVSGLKSNDTITCYSLSGQETGAEIDRYENGADISLKNMAPGTYIISINNNKSIKVLKR